MVPANAVCQAPASFGSVWAEDNCPAATATITAGVSSTSNGASFPLVVQSSGPSYGELLGVGVYNASFTATDSAGNTDTCIATLKVRDVTPPTIACPSQPLYINTTANACTAVVVFPTVPAQDNCGNVTVTTPFGLQNQSLVSPGLYKVHMQAVDAAGNQAQCTVSVEVTDTSPPSISKRPRGKRLAARIYIFIING